MAPPWAMNPVSMASRGQPECLVRQGSPSIAIVFFRTISPLTTDAFFNTQVIDYVTCCALQALANTPLNIKKR